LAQSSVQTWSLKNIIISESHLTWFARRKVSSMQWQSTS
jgi:hypothetical protein